MPKKNRIDSRILLINEINAIDEPDGLSELSEKIKELREDKKKLDALEVKNLIDLYASCGEGLRDAIQELRKRDSETKNTYLRLMKKLSKDYTALINYEKYLKKEEDPKLLDIEEFFEKSRTRTISLNGQSLFEMKQVGAGQSVRYLVTVPLKDEPIGDELGLKEKDTFTAYFTENTEYERGDTSYSGDKEAREAVLLQVEKEAIKKIEEKYPVLRNLIRMEFGGDRHSPVYDFFMKQIPQEYRNSIQRNTEQMLTDNSVTEIFSLWQDIADRAGNDDMCRGVIGHFRHSSEEERQAAVTGLAEFASMISKASLSLELKKGLGIPYHASTGQRNALMSSVAELFGCEDVLAFSEKVNIKSFENGQEKVRKGVIMMPAKGEDPIHAGLNSNMSKLDRSKMENSPGLNNKIAKLQFLDYICGNPDRHQGNIFYQFSEEGKLIGVQGIDNDASFGANKDFYKMRIDNVYGKDQVIKVGNSVRFEDLRLIPESMADTVMNLNPDTYAFQLYGYGLEEKEIEACSHRLIDLKRNLKKCMDHYKDRAEGDLDPEVPRIVPDDRMDQYSANEQLATDYKKEQTEATRQIMEAKGLGKAETQRRLFFLQQKSNNDNIFGNIRNFGDQKQNLIMQMNDSITFLYKNSYDYEKTFFVRGKGSFISTLKEMELENDAQTKPDPAFAQMFAAVNALMSNENSDIRKPLIKKSGGTFVKAENNHHGFVPEYQFIDEPLNQVDRDAFYGLKKEPEEEDQIITTSTKNREPEDNLIITTEIKNTEDNLIITTDTEKKGVWDPEDEGLTPEQLARKYSTLPESIKTIPKSDIYTRLNEALDKVYDYLSDSAAQKVMDEYQTIQFCLSDPAYAKDHNKLMADLTKLKDSDEYKKYEMARTMRDRLTEQLERYVKVKEECGELRKAAVRAEHMTKAEYDPYEGSRLQQEAKQKVEAAKEATEKMKQPGTEHKDIKLKPESLLKI